MNSDEAVDLALACFRDPGACPEHLAASMPLPEGMGRLLAAAMGTPAVLDKAARKAGTQPDAVRRAALALIPQICFGRNASHYRVLGLEPGASCEAIEDRYRCLLSLYPQDRADGQAWVDLQVLLHPSRLLSSDRTDSDGGAAAYPIRINQAYRVLSNTETRARYDTLLKRSALRDSGAGRPLQERRHPTQEQRARVMAQPQARAVPRIPSPPAAPSSPRPAARSAVRPEPPAESKAAAEPAQRALTKPLKAPPRTATLTGARAPVRPPPSGPTRLGKVQVYLPVALGALVGVFGLIMLLSGPGQVDLQTLAGVQAEASRQTEGRQATGQAPSHALISPEQNALEPKTPAERPAATADQPPGLAGGLPNDQQAAPDPGPLAETSGSTAPAAQSRASASRKSAAPVQRTRTRAASARSPTASKMQPAAAVGPDRSPARWETVAPVTRIAQSSVGSSPLRKALEAAPRSDPTSTQALPTSTAGRQASRQRVSALSASGSARPILPSTEPKRLTGEWYEEGYLQRLRATRSPCRATAANKAPRIILRHSQGQLHADVEYRSNDRRSVRLPPTDHEDEVSKVVHHTEGQGAGPTFVDTLSWQGKTNPRLVLVRDHEKGNRVVFHYRRVSRQEWNRILIAGVYQDRSGRQPGRIVITPEGRFESEREGFQFSIPTDCAAINCDLLKRQGNAGRGTGDSGYLGFSHTKRGLEILPISERADGTGFCRNEPLMVLQALR